MGKGERRGLEHAFAVMNERGLIARMNFSCCGNCGGYELATIVEELLGAVDASQLEVEKAKINGVVFFHEQDNEHRENGVPFMLRYGVVDTSKFGEVGLPTEDVGALVMKILSECNVKATWNGDPNTCIEVAAGQ